MTIANPLTPSTYCAPLRDAASRPPSPSAHMRTTQKPNKRQSRQPPWQLTTYLAVMCNFTPHGQCRRPQYEASLYCRFHTCIAQLEDGTRCCNFVAHPTKSQICNTGYHRENDTLAPVLRMIERRHQSNLQLQAEFEEYECRRERAKFELPGYTSNDSFILHSASRSGSGPPSRFGYR